MSAPIGSIEFLVKFDTMSSSFRNALVEALKEIKPTTGGAGIFPKETLKNLEDQLSIIRFNLETRIRSPLGGDWAKFMLTQRVPEIKYAQTGEALEKTLTTIRFSPTGKRYFGQRGGETEEEWKERTEKLADIVLKRYTEELEKGGEQSYYEKIRRKLPQWQAFLQASTEGEREQFMKFFIEQLIPETFLEEQLRARLGEALVDIGAGQKRAYRLKIPVGEGEELTKANIYDVLSEKFTIDQLKELLYGDVSLKLDDQDIIDTVKELLEEYTLPELKVYFPQRLLNVIEDLIKSGDIALSEDLQEAFKAAGSRIYTRTGPEEYKKWDIMQGLKEEFSEKVEEVFRDILPEATFDLFWGELEQRWLASLEGVAILPTEIGKVVGALKEAEKAKLLAPFQLFAGLGQSPGETQAYQGFLENILDVKGVKAKDLEDEKERNRILMEVIKTTLDSVAGTVEALPEDIREELEDIGYSLPTKPNEG